MEIENVQKEMGIINVNGVSLGPQLMAPPKTIRSSISRPFEPAKTPEQIIE